MLKVVKINSTYPQATNCVQSSWNWPYMIYGPSWTNLSNSFFKLKMYWKFWPQSHQTLTYHNQTWYIDPWHHHGDTQTIWWPLTSGGRQTGSELISLQGLHLSKPNLPHSLMTLSWWYPNNWASSTPRGALLAASLLRPLESNFNVFFLCIF